MLIVTTRKLAFSLRYSAGQDLGFMEAESETALGDLNYLLGECAALIRLSQCQTLNIHQGLLAVAVTMMLYPVWGSTS